MILRIVLGALPPRTDAHAVLDLRDRLGRLARDVRGLDSLILGTRHPAAAGGRTDATVVTVWRDAETMVRAIGTDEADRFLATRLHLPFEIDHADHFEIVGRSFAALPPDGQAVLRVVRVRGRPNEEARLIETLRDQQPRLVDLGLVASHIGRRVVGRDVEAVTVSVWPDQSTITAATDRESEEPIFAKELAPWADRLTLEIYDGIEVAPRLPTPTGTPIIVFDDDLRIVDVTASAAAAVGWSAEDLVGRSLREVSMTDQAVFARNLTVLMDEGVVVGEGTWHVPDAGRVFIRYVSRRDVPVHGRHVALIHRWQDPAPTVEDLDAALEAAFGWPHGV